MKKILSAAVALSLLVSAGAASAQPGPQRHGDHQQQQSDRHDDRFERHADRRYKAGRYHPPRGYKARAWRHGDRLPAQYRSRAYVVDYHRYGLRAPPRGYQYVRVGDDVVLAAAASGLISSVIYQIFQ